MKTEPIAAARVAYDADGLPRSMDCDDVYFPRQGALAQARHVFLAGNGLPERWRGRSSFVILETGFGFGNNFLAAWQHWRSDPQRPARLHFISIESAPPSRETLRLLQRDGELAALAEELVAAWPPLTCNLHLLDFDAGAVRLSLAFGKAAAWLPQIVARVDAFFLDGFAPARNPSMWEPRLFKAMARLAAPGATVATWTAASDVRAGLRSAGFTVQAAAGNGGKRDITLARFEPSFLPRGAPRDVAAHTTEPVLIVGAGLAGCAVAAALAARGRASILVERNGQIADGGSGNEAALFHGVVHADDGRHARFYRAAALLTQGVVGAAIADHGVSGSAGGLLRLAPDASWETLAAVVERLGLPRDYVSACSAAEASERAGLGIATPAWYFPGGGWVAPRELAAYLLRRAGPLCELRTAIEVAALRREAEGWHLLDAAGATLFKAGTLVLANAHAAFAGPGAGIALSRQRAQVSGVSIERWAGASPRLPIAGSGYLTPRVAGRLWFGASAVADDGLADDEACAPNHEANLARLGQLLARPPALTTADLTGRRAVRWATADRLPIIGAVAAQESAERSVRFDQPRFIERAPGLYACLGLGSRGVMSALLGAEIVAAAITGQPGPVEADLLDAVDPARFISRVARRDLAREPASRR